MNFNDGRVRSQNELRAAKKMLRILVSGARLVMREYARLKEVAEGDARELRQLSINTFVENGEIKRAKKIVKSVAVHSNSPPDSVWGVGRKAADCKLNWDLAIGSTLDPLASSFLPRNFSLPRNSEGQPPRIAGGVSKSN